MARDMPISPRTGNTQGILMKRRLLHGFKGGKGWMVGKSATVAFGRGVAECHNTFLSHSFFTFLSTQDLKNS
jgi:hypothetical protein